MPDRTASSSRVHPSRARDTRMRRPIPPSAFKPPIALPICRQIDQTLEFRQARVCHLTILASMATQRPADGEGRGRDDQLGGGDGAISDAVPPALTKVVQAARDVIDDSDEI